MPFVRFSRDKRGYEQIALVHAANRRGRPSRPRILYWFRTPPGVKVGREPFDEPVRRALEAQNPDVIFDWKKIAQAKMPPPAEIEPWRERRRAEREAKQARREQELSQSDEADQVASTEAPAPEFPAPAEPVTAVPADPAMPAVPLATSSRRRRRRRGGRRRSAVDSGLPESSQQPAGGPEPMETAIPGASDDES